MRGVLALVGVMAIWFAFISNRVRLQQDAVRELSATGITVHYDYQHAALSTRQLALRGSAWGPLVVPNDPRMTTSAPDWLRRLLGDDYFCSVTATTIPVGQQHTVDDILRSLWKLPCLEEVLLINNGVPEIKYTQLIKQLKDKLPRVKITDAMDDAKLL